jgi:hypothetical protein
MARYYDRKMVRKFPARRSGATVQLGVRLSEGLRRQLADAAKVNGRSLNSEVVMRLTASFEPQAEARQVVAGDLAKALLQLIKGEP